MSMLLIQHVILCMIDLKIVCMDVLLYYLNMVRSLLYGNDTFMNWAELFVIWNGFGCMSVSISVDATVGSAISWAALTPNLLKGVNLTGMGLIYPFFS